MILAQLFASSGNATVAWVTALTFAAFILVVNGPAWALVPILINEMTLYGYLNPSFGMAQRFVVAGLAAALAATAILRGRRLNDRRMRRVLIPAIGFVLIVTVMNMQHSEETYVYQYLRYQLVQVIMLVIAACAIRHVRELRQIAVIAVIVTAAVGLIAIWQHYAPASALYGMREGTQQGRVVGLVNSPVPLADQFIFVFVPLLGFLIARPFRWERKHIFLIGAALLIGAGLNFTYTRSAVFALAPALVAMGLLFRGRRRMLTLGAVVMAVVLFFALENTGLIGFRYYRDAEDDRSASSHEALRDVSVAIALDNSLTGIGHEDFTTVSLEYIDVIDERELEVGGVAAVGNHQPHNDFLNVWLSWGIVALIAFVAIFAGALRNFVAAARSRDLFIRGLAIGGVGGLVAYGVNSYFHNSMDSSVFLWLYAGLSVALARLATDARISDEHSVATLPRP